MTDGLNRTTTIKPELSLESDGINISVRTKCLLSYYDCSINKISVKTYFSFYFLEINCHDFVSLKTGEIKIRISQGY